MPNTFGEAGSLDIQFGQTIKRSLPPVIIVETTSAYSSLTGYDWKEVRLEPGTGFVAPSVQLTGDMAFDIAGSETIPIGTRCAIAVDRDQIGYDLWIGGQSLAWKSPPARARTTAPLPACTYANGSSGVGATLTGDANGALPAQDGVSIIAGNTILVGDQANTIHNGLYTVTQVGSVGTPFILTRRGDADSYSDLYGAVVSVMGGTVYNDTVWLCDAGVIGGSAVLWRRVDRTRNWLDPVRFKTTGNVDLAGGGLAAGTSHDGVTAVIGDRVLVGSQTVGVQNGVYTVPASGAAARSHDAPSADVTPGSQVTVLLGSAFKGTTWLCTRYLLNHPTTGDSGPRWVLRHARPTETTAGGGMLTGPPWPAAVATFDSETGNSLGFGPCRFLYDLGEAGGGVRSHYQLFHSGNPTFRSFYEGSLIGAPWAGYDPGDPGAVPVTEMWASLDSGIGVDYSSGGFKVVCGTSDGGVPGGVELRTVNSGLNSTGQWFLTGYYKSFITSMYPTNFDNIVIPATPGEMFYWFRAASDDGNTAIVCADGFAVHDTPSFPLPDYRTKGVTGDLELGAAVRGGIIVDLGDDDTAVLDGGTW